MENVYVALIGSSRQPGVNILGIYSSRISAEERCSNERSYTRNGWKKLSDFGFRLDNGLGLYVEVVEYSVK